MTLAHQLTAPLTPHEAPHTHPLLQGLAVGDRNGGPIRLALLLCGAMNASDVFDVERVFQAYQGWFEAGEAYDTGPTLASVVGDVRRGAAREEVVRRRYAARPSDGVGPAHRAAPLALWLKGEALDEALRAEAALSHGSPTSASVSVAVGRLCATLLEGASFDEALTSLESSLDELSLPDHLTRRALQSTRLDELSRGGQAPEVLRAALWFLTHTTSFTEALTQALAFAGPSNYCPVLVGSLGGCLYKNVPHTLMRHPQLPDVFLGVT